MDYEFSEEQNRVIARAVTGARLSALSLFALAAWKGVYSFLHADLVQAVLYPIFSGLLGVLFWRVSQALEQIVKTEGSDIIHLTQAFREMDRIFRGVRNAQLLMIVVAILSIGAAIVSGAMTLAKLFS